MKVKFEKENKTYGFGKDKKAITSLFCECGIYYSRVIGISISGIAMRNYRRKAEFVEFISGDRIALYVFMRLIKGNSFNDTLNRIFDKQYLKDSEYHTFPLTEKQ